MGGLLVVMTVAAGLYLAARPGPTPLDRWIPNPLAGSRSGWLTGVTLLRYPAVIVTGSVVAGAVTVRRNRARALACLVGPPLALILCELVFKPLVGRTVGGGLSFPSGSTVGAAGLATVAVLATPVRWRKVTVVAAAAYASWMAVAVVSLGWHYPTDALGGLALGWGVVLSADGLAPLLVPNTGWGSGGRRSASDPPPTRPDPVPGA